MRRLLAGAAVGLLGVSAAWMPTAGASTETPAAPTIVSVTIGNASLKVSWTAPAGVPGAQITAYDLRYIRSSAADKSDSNWTVRDSVWTSGGLEYTLTGLTNSIYYDIQMRTVTTVDGAWSATSTGIAVNATAIGLNESKTGNLSSYGDIDYFQLTLSQASDVIVRMTGSVRNANWVVATDTLTTVGGGKSGFLFPNERHLLLRKRLEAGVYYISIAPRHNASSIADSAETGTYKLHVDSVTEPGDTAATAGSLAVGGVEGGNLTSSTDADYLKITVSASTDTVIRAISHNVDVDGELLDSSQQQITAAIYEETFSRPYKTFGFTIRHTLAAGTYYVKLSASGGSTPGVYTIQAIDADDIPADSRHDDILKGCGTFTTAITDPLFRCQWHLKNTGLYGGTAGEDINVEQAWATSKGEGVGVAVVDQAIDFDHRDLRENVDESLSKDYLGSAVVHRYFSDPLLSHGTPVAGIIAARDNGRGVVGVAPRATIYGYNYLLNQTTVNMVDAMTRNPDKTAVSNNSWGRGSDGGFYRMESTFDRALDRGVTEGFDGKGIVYVISAGNSHSYDGNVNYSEDTNYYAMTTVCAVNHKGTRASYSETGAALWVCAPSKQDSYRGTPSVKTIYPYTYTGFSGTSASAPMVSGVVALIRSAYPDLSWRDVKLILAGSARKNDSSNSGWETGAIKHGSTTDRYNYNHQYGFGVVDAKAAIDLAADWTPVTAMAAETQTSADKDISISSPDTPVTSTVVIGSDVKFTEFVELNVAISADAMRDLDVELESPAGKISKIVEYCKPITIPSTPDMCSQHDRRSLTGSFRFGSARHLGENPAGTWKLRITDKVTGGALTTTLKSWSLKVYGYGYPPQAPAVNSTTAVDDGSVTVFWTPPSDTGTFPVDSYQVRHITSDADDSIDGNWTVSSSLGGRTRGHTITGLTNGTGYKVQVRAVSASGDGAWPTSVTATPSSTTNALPYFTEGSTTARSVVEGTAAGQGVGTAVAAVDTGCGTLSYTLGGTDASSFTIVNSSGQIQAKDALDYETETAYTVTVSVSDGKDSSCVDDATDVVDATATVSISIVDVEEAGTVSLSSAAPQIGQAITATLTDPDGGVTSTTWRWERSTGQTTWAAIDGATAASYTPVSGDSGSYLRAKATYTDARGPFKTAQAATTSAVPALTASSVTHNSAILTLAHHTGDWWLKRTAPSIGTCTGGSTTYIDMLTNLAANTSYTYQAHSNDTCSALLASETFKTAKPPALTASSVTHNSATLTLAHHTGDWWLKRTAPSIGTCTGGSTTYIDMLTNLASNTSHTYQAHSNDTCSALIAAETFRTNSPPIPRPFVAPRLIITLPAPPPSPLPPPLPPPPPKHDIFSDLADAGVHETAVRILASEGVFDGTGCGSGALCPNQPLPRWEFAVWMVRAHDKTDPPPLQKPARFEDVSRRAWWAPYVERLAELRITLGCSKTPSLFCPDGSVTRSQMASFLTRALKLPAAKQPAGFQDTADWHNTADIDALYAYGITKGCSKHPPRYCPSRKTTRAAMASFLYRARSLNS